MVDEQIGWGEARVAPPAVSGAAGRTSARRRRRLLLACFAAFCAAIALAVAQGDVGGQQIIRTWYHEGGIGPDLRAFFGPFGKGEVLILVCALVGLAGRRRVAAAMIVALLLSGLVVGILKPAVDRERPDGGNFSFPSGDVTAMVAVATVMVVEAPVVAVPAAIVTAAVGIIRIGLGRHYPSDTLAGIAAGILIALVAFRVTRVRRWLAHRQIHAVLAFVLIAAGLVGFSFERGSVALDLAIRWLTAPLVVLIGARLAREAARHRTRLGAWEGMRGAVVVAIVSLALSWTIATRSTLWDRDEPRFARAAVEMLESGDWMVPTFNGALRPDKPPLIYWLMSTSLRLAGPTEWAVRAWAGIGLSLAVLITAFVARRLFGTRAALLAALTLATAPLALMTGTVATTDAVLLACTTAATAIVALAILDGWRWWVVPSLGAALGLGLLAKGPVAIAPPLLAALVATVMLRRTVAQQIGRRVAVVAGAAVVAGLAMFLAWGIPANGSTGGELAARGLGHHVVARMLQPLESHGGNAILSLPFYVLALPLLFLPWTLYLPAAIAHFRRGGPVDVRARAIVVAWALPTFVLMSLVQTKLVHYILPIFPALAIAVAAVVIAADEGRLDDVSRRWLRRGAWLMGAVGLSFGGTLAVAAWFLPLPGARPAIAAMGLTMIVVTLVALRLQASGEHLAAAFAMGLGMFAFGGEIAATLPKLEPFKPAPAIAQSLRDMAPSTRLAMSGFVEPSLVFYAGRTIERVDDIAAWAAQPAARAAIVDAATLERAGGADALRMRVVREQRGFNYVKGKWVDVVVLARE